MLTGRAPFGVLTSLLRKTGSHTPLGNFSSKRGNKNFYKGRGGNKYGRPAPKGGFMLARFPNFRMPSLDGFRLKPYVVPGEGMIKTNVLEKPTSSGD